jgi:hypothetical protein
MKAAEVIAHINQRFDASYQIVGRYAAGESGSASQVVDEASRRYVLKFGAAKEFHPDDAARRTRLLRSLGYPAPEYVVVGSFEKILFSLQRVMPGEPLGFRVQPALLPQLLHLNDLQSGRGEDQSDEPARIIRGVMEGYVDFCIIDTFRAYSADTAALHEELQRVVTDNASDCPKRNDIVHFDFHTNNILIDGDRVTGVIDWEGSESGDCAFDLATLLFYTWQFRDFRERLWKALIGRTTPGAVAVYLAHMMVRQLDWSMRHHARETINQYIRNSREILRQIDLI